MSILRFCIFITLAFSSIVFAADSSIAKKPNILLIVADDLGYTDLSLYGSEIQTPNLDALAKEGMLLTGFYAGTTCSPTRSMLFSGTDNHLAGLGMMAENPLPNRIGQDGFETYLNDNIASLGDLMTDAGYNTYMAGKWHLGMTEETSPRARGMKRSFALLEGGAAHLSGISLLGPDLAPYRDDDELITVGDDFYSSRVYTEKMISYIESDREDGKPFFAYLAYTAPHWPLQAPLESIARFKGMYDDGYESLYQERFSQLQKLGLMPDGAKQVNLDSFQPRWDSLNQEQKMFESRKMEVYAAMVSDMDAYVGALISYLKSIDEFDNTLIMFMSDNGAEGGDLAIEPYTSFLKDWATKCCDNSYENLGAGDSYILYGPNWARASGGPYRADKGSMFEGGFHVPAFARFPEKIAMNSRNDSLMSVMDLLPTFLDLAGSPHPGTTYRNKPVLPVKGKSILSVLNGDESSIHDDDFIANELYGLKTVRKGAWKIVWDPSSNVDEQWQLYNILNDPSEQINLATVNTEKVDELLLLWKSYEQEVGLGL